MPASIEEATKKKPQHDRRQMMSFGSGWKYVRTNTKRDIHAIPRADGCVVGTWCAGGDRQQKFRSGLWRQTSIFGWGERFFFWFVLATVACRRKLKKTSATAGWSENSSSDAVCDRRDFGWMEILCRVRRKIDILAYVNRRTIAWPGWH